MRNPSDPTQKIVNYARETLEYLKARENFWRSQQPIVRFRPFKDKSARVHKTVGALLFFLSFFVFLFLSFFLLVPTDQLVFFFLFYTFEMSFLPSAPFNYRAAETSPYCNAWEPKQGHSLMD